MAERKSLQDQLDHCERERVAAVDDNYRKAKRIKDLEQEVADLKATIEGIYRSSSWRVGAPLRAPRQLIINLRQWRAWWQQQAARAGGTKALLQHGWQTLKQAPLPALKGALARWRSEGRFRPTPISWPADRYNYTAWLARYADTPVTEKVAEKPAENTQFSVLLPVYNAPIDLLEQAIDSVLTQSYKNWELCIADDASTDPAVHELLKRKQAEDSRVKVVLRDRNGHISAATNSALEIAQGEYIALLDQDDLLAPHALQSMAETIAKNPDAVIIYSDEDRIDAAGQIRSEPYFKPNFNYALFLSQNMVSHLGVYRRENVQAVGGLRVGMEGSQDHDLALRVLEQIDHRQVIHVPQVLYHWRAIPGSTALDVGEKGYAFRAGARAIQEHLRRTGQAGVVEPCRDLAIFHTVKQPVPASASVAVLLGPGAAMPGHTAVETQAALQAGLNQAQPSDWAHAEQSLSEAAAQRTEDFLVWINLPIAQAEPEWLDTLLGWANTEFAGFVAPRIWDAADRMDYGGVIFPAPGRACYAHQGWPIGTESFQLYGYGGRALLHQRFTALAPVFCVVQRQHVLTHLPNGTGEPALLQAMLNADAAGLHNLWIPQASVRLPAHAPIGRWNILDAPGLNDQLHPPQPDPAYHPQLSARGDFSLPWPPTA